jgi:hypothetical protein
MVNWHFCLKFLSYTYIDMSYYMQLKVCNTATVHLVRRKEYHAVYSVARCTVQ